ncbi:MAG: DNA helicase RecQ, partial [Gemmatimonadaceae bacterium]|nr:DNA helicase RecQ [Gloeobacterales cyanobacterium ES-bin-141]
GLTVVVSPLIALMHDQVDRLRDNGIAAAFINSSMSSQERARREQAALRGELKLLYVAPERLLSEGFLELLDRIKERVGLSLLAIDEAHCISEWGHDFRPEYRKIVQVRRRYPDLPVLCLTATATERVREDIVRQLALKDHYLHVASFNRPNLYYDVRTKDKRSFAELLGLLEEDPQAPVIVYCQSRKSVEQLAERLSESGIKALPYHAGLGATERSEHQDRFIRDDVAVLVATVAFGMGIGKPDVRAVVHYDLPRNLEGYYQESGRAGRDGQPAKCILYFSHGDRAKVEYMIAQKSDLDEQRIARQQLNQVVAYAESTVCRRRIQLGYFGEALAGQNCGNCDNCLSPVLTEDRTVDAQKLLSCVARCKERFGMRHIVDVLRGADTERIRARGHDQLSTYGIGKERGDDEWMRLGRALLHQGLLTETTDGYPVLKLNPLAWEVLRGQRNVHIAAAPVAQPKPPASPKQERAVTSTPDLEPVDEILFQQLRQLRKRLADAQGVPPYVVFPDATLRAMAQQRPQSEAEFLAIPGVGQRKLDAYFADFTGAIRTVLP